ncbi:MAG TPA: FAD-dependent oxidoreductase [Thermoleophilaceae bacterium]|nr:FAD-dependent oxidoreductase [Thermoleophilaceae bacterium]
MNANPPHVAVVGGGLAGITAALRLAQRHYDVTLYEQKPVLGGNLASRPTDFGVDLDVYPHMFLSWYHNFWRMLQDAGVRRDEAFAPLHSVKQLKKPRYPGDFPAYAGLTDGYSPKHTLRNLFSGVGPPSDMFVFWYSAIDLLAERFNPTMNLDNVSVTGFLEARPYITERAVAACDNFITMVWAIPAYQASAEDYREYLAYSVSSYKPPSLLAKAPASEAVIAPLEAALERAGVEICRSKEITGISCDDNGVTQMKIGDADSGEEEAKPVDELLLALPPLALSAVMRQPAEEGGTPVVKIAPKLAELKRLHSQQIPIVHVWFKDKLKYIPPDPVGLYRSDLALAFTDVSQLWTGFPEFSEHTVLSVSASNPYGLPGTGDEDDGFAIIKGLSDYLGFPPGAQWGDSPAIRWDRTVYESNADSQLFINETGVDAWRPDARAEGVPNLWFAGNFCANRIGMMTVESAVASGLEAVRAIVAKRRLGTPPDIVEPSASFDALSVWLRYVYGPYAMGARAMSEGSDMLRTFLRCLGPSRSRGPGFGPEA